VSKVHKTIADIALKKLTPMLNQYMKAKESCGDSILLFRMGDFYEMFFEDAVEASKILEIALTSRDAGSIGRVPMCGVPFRAADNYIVKLIRAGKTVALCDQVEDPKLAKGIVKREIVRTITPGTIMSPAVLDEKGNNYLAALFAEDGVVGLAFADLTTGELLATELRGDGAGKTLQDELARMSPAECIYPESKGNEPIVADAIVSCPAIEFTATADDRFDHTDARKLITGHYGVQSLKGLGLDRLRAATAATGASLGYLEETQKTTLTHLQPVRVYNSSSYLMIDANSQRNLELTETIVDRKRRGSLLGVLDMTVTSMGARKLRRWLLHPLRDVDSIRELLDAVEELLRSTEARMELRSALERVSDLERATSRLSCGHGNGRDLRALCESLKVLPEIVRVSSSLTTRKLTGLRDSIDTLEETVSLLDSSIVEDPPITVTEGNIIRDGYDPELDRLRDMVRGGRTWIASLKKKEIERTGIPTLKIGYNKVFGYYIEVTKANVHLVPDDYIRKQTLVNAERYVTPELKEREEEIVGAEDKMATLEYDLFQKVREAVCNQAGRVLKDASIVAELDVLGSLAEVAAKNDYCKPEISDDYTLSIEEGRHPVVEQMLTQGTFVPNDTFMDAKDAGMLIITGPNMAGKSTYLRQVALIVIMAQMGGFVPARQARIGVVDRIFTRVGAADNLVSGESTFMVEMNETANILNSATDRSLLILDEIGRGTSTFDGISIAWSVAEDIHNRVGAKAVFATHYHELTNLVNSLERAKNLNVAVREWQGKVIFLYRVVDGSSDHSYGIQVARLAGLPKHVITRAHEIMSSLEEGSPAQTRIVGKGGGLQLALPFERTPSKAENELKKIEPDRLAPREALDLLYHLKSLLENEPGS